MLGFDFNPLENSDKVRFGCLCDGRSATSSYSWLSDFGGFPVTSSSMTVKSKSVLHTKLVVLARIESVLSEK